MAVDQQIRSMIFSVIMASSMNVGLWGSVGPKWGGIRVRVSGVNILSGMGPGS